MISTLIRGGGAPLPSTQRYREEYLVDTETNEIIYPKVLSSSIVPPPSSDGSSDIKIPSFSGSGIDPSTYISKSVSLSGKVINLSSGIVLEEKIPSPGVWAIEYSFVPSGSTIGSGTNVSASITIKSDCDWESSKYQFIPTLTSCWVIMDKGTICKINESVHLQVFLGASNSNKTLGANAKYTFKAIKLCDLPPEEETEME